MKAFHQSFHRRGRGLLLPAALLLVAACQRPEEPPQPADLLPQEKMVALLAELHVLEARVENSRLPADSARSLYLSQQKLLMRQQQVTDSAFQRSYRYYGIHGKDLDNIYKVVIDTLKNRETRLQPPPVSAGPPPHNPPR